MRTFLSRACSNNDLSRSFPIDPLHSRLDFLIVYELGFQFATEAMRPEGPILGKRIRVLLGEFAVVEVAEFPQAGDGFRHLPAFGIPLFEGPPEFGDGVGAAGQHAQRCGQMVREEPAYLFANRSTLLDFSISSRAASVVLLIPAMRSLNSSGLVEFPKASSSVISPCEYSS